MKDLSSESRKHINKEIIGAILSKAELVCPDRIDLIGIYGSYVTGDRHEKSDLDLCIVIRNPDGWKISHAFILDDIGYDIYCTTWSQLEELSEFKTPYIAKLLDLEIVYSADEDSLTRLKRLQDHAHAILNSDLKQEDYQRAEAQLDRVKQSYATLMLNETISDCYLALSNILYYTECTLFLLNKTHISHGVKRMPEFITQLGKLPEDFSSLYQACIYARDIAETKETATKLLRNLSNLMTEVKDSVHSPTRLTAEALKGSYEEAYSNWKSKMELAEKTNNRYLAFMSAASFQQFYEAVLQDYDVPKLDVLSCFSNDDRSAELDAFLAGMHQLRTLYNEQQATLATYADIADFKENYLKP